MKEAITTAPVLAYYDPGKPLTLENDACEYGIGSALIQGGKPIAFASRSLSDSERRYAQIEKEMLAVTYGLEKFHHYTFGRQVFVVTDHKPLVSISNKQLSKAPKRLQNLLMRAQRYTFELRWSPGTEIPVADVLEISKGLWSVMIVKDLPYRYVWNLSIPCTRDSISRSILL